MAHVRVQRYPGGDRIPVVYVTAPPKGSPYKQAMEFARYLGLPPVRSRQNVTDVTDAVCQVLTDARTDLVIVDEIHNLNLGTSAGEDLSDHLKYFIEHLPATFVYAGIDVNIDYLYKGERASKRDGFDGGVLGESVEGRSEPPGGLPGASVEAGQPGAPRSRTSDCATN